MQLKDVLSYALFMITMTATCIQAESKIQDTEERPLDKRINRRIATLVVDDVLPIARVFQQPKVIYRRLSKKSYTPPRPTYGPRRTKYGPPRTLKKPGKKYRGKNGSKHAPFPNPYKKRAPNPRYGPPKRSTMKPVYGPPKKNHRTIFNGIGFGEPPADYMLNKYQPPKPSEFTRTRTPEFAFKITSKPHDVDFSSPATYNDNFSNKPPNDGLWAQHEYESASSHLGYGEPPVDSYGAPIKPNLHDLTFSTAQSFIESTSHLDEDRNFGPESRPWNNFKGETDNNYAYSKKHTIFTEPDDNDNIFVTPATQKHNEELHLNSYSDIYNYRQEEQAKQEKKRGKKYYQKNVKMLNHPWIGAKMKDDPKEDIIVGGQYAEPPARSVAKQESNAPLFVDNSGFSTFIDVDDKDDMSPISSYVNYKNSNMAFSPQNLNDVFSIVDK